MDDWKEEYVICNVFKGNQGHPYGILPPRSKITHKSKNNATAVSDCQILSVAHNK